MSRCPNRTTPPAHQHRNSHDQAQHRPTALIRIYGSDGQTSTLHPLRDVLSRRTIATLAAIEEGGRQ